MWNLDTGKIIAKWTGHMTSVESVCWSGDCERVMSGCFDGTVRVWDGESGNAVLEIETGLSQVWAAIYSPDTTTIATCGDGEEKFISIWNANTGKRMAVSSQAHLGIIAIIQCDCGTLKTVSPSVRPSRMHSS
jgi:WD40 repeat protein